MNYFKRFTQSVALLGIILLALNARLPAADANDDDPWSKVSKQAVIGQITLQLTNQEVHVAGSNLNVTLPWRMPTVSDYLCAVRNPFAQPRIEDGYVVSDANFQLLESYDGFKASAFPRFAFFTNRPTTIGLITGHAAANGSSDQKLLLVDVENGSQLLTRLDDGKMPQWLEQTNLPPAFVTWRSMGYKGWHQSCVGQAYRFKDGSYQRDVATERRLLADEFQKAQLTAAQRQELRTANQFVLDDWMSPTGAGQALGDFLYYGTRTGNAAAVDALLATLKPELRASLNELRQAIIAEARTNVVTGTVALPNAAVGPDSTLVAWGIQTGLYTVKSGDQGYRIAQQFHVPFKALDAANPWKNWKRLKVGQALMIPGYGWNWEKPETFNDNTDANERDFTVVHRQLGLKVELFTYVGTPHVLSWQQERGNVWSLTYFAGDPGTQYSFSIIRKAVFNVRTHELLADNDLRYENLKGPGQLPSLQPEWTWLTNGLVINDPQDGPPVTIPLDKMQ